MDIDEADRGNCNPHFGDSDSFSMGYYHNCQTCTLTYELRRRGFNLNAMRSPEGAPDYFYEFCNKNKLDWRQRFLNPDGSAPTYKNSIRYTKKHKDATKAKFIESNTSQPGRYEVYCEWFKDKAHVFIVERQPSGNLIWFDPQTGKIGKEVKEYLADMAEIWVLRIDDKIINPKFASRFLKA